MYFRKEKKGIINFSTALRSVGSLVIPIFYINGVFKVLLILGIVEPSLCTSGIMSPGIAAVLTREVAVNTAKLTVSYKTPREDRFVLAAALKWNVTLWTQDAGFERIEGVRSIYLY